MPTPLLVYTCPQWNFHAVIPSFFFRNSWRALLRLTASSSEVRGSNFFLQIFNSEDLGKVIRHRSRVWTTEQNVFFLMGRWLCNSVALKWLEWLHANAGSADSVRESSPIWWRAVVRLHSARYHFVTGFSATSRHFPRGLFSDTCSAILDGVFLWPRYLALRVGMWYVKTLGLLALHYWRNHCFGSGIQWID